MNQLHLTEQILLDVRQMRDQLKRLMMQAVTAGQQLEVKRNHFKVLEDEIISDIWNNPAYKNDKQRNEQKHLARINDTRITEAQGSINLLDLDRAQIHADILLTQNMLTVFTIQYQYAMTGTAAAVQLDLVPLEVKQADTSTVIESELKLHAPVVSTDSGFAPAVPTAKAVSLREQLANAIPDARKAELAAGGELSDADLIRLIEGYRACAICGKAVDTNLPHHNNYGSVFCNDEHLAKFQDDPANKPYLKPDSGKKPEKIGNVRI